MEFEKRLERAIQRGQRSGVEHGRETAAKVGSEEDLKGLHTQLRIELSEHIEECLRRVADHFLGFKYETVFGDEGWGARISRDDVQVRAGQSPSNAYSRLQLVIRPFSSARIVELNARGAIRNKETISRSHFQFLAEADVDSFRELIDLWVLEYAEQYATGK